MERPFCISNYEKTRVAVLSRLVLKQICSIFDNILDFAEVPTGQPVKPEIDL